MISTRTVGLCIAPGFLWSGFDYGTVLGRVKASFVLLEPVALECSTRDHEGMSRFPAEVRRLLAPAVKAARIALDDLEPDEVPASLRRVTSHSGGRLPPPLAVSVLRLLDENEWLREKTIEALDSADPESAAVAFLTRPPGWWERVAIATANVRSADLEAAADRARRESNRAADQLVVARRRLKASRAELEEERSRARSRGGPVQSAEAAGTGVTEARFTQARARIAELEEDLASEVDDRIEAEAIIARVRSRLRKSDRAHGSSGPVGAVASSLETDPLAIAKSLDLMAAAAPHRDTSGTAEGVPARREPLELPRGMRPDTAGAIEWLASLDDAVTVLVDGYNVLHNMDPGSFTTAPARSRLIADLARWRRRAGTARVVIVYDSGLPGDRDLHISDGGVEIVFADEDHLADDEIVDLASSAKGSVIVVTSDRDLQRRSEAVGALALWSEALAGWIG